MNDGICPSLVEILPERTLFSIDSLCRHLQRRQEDEGVLDFCLPMEILGHSQKDILTNLSMLSQKGDHRWQWCLKGDLWLEDFELLRKSHVTGVHYRGALCPLDDKTVKSFVASGMHLEICLEKSVGNNGGVAVVPSALTQKKSGVHKITIQGDNFSESCQFKIFYEELLAHAADSLESVMQAMDWDEDELLGMWMEWQKKRFPREKIEGPFVFNTWPFFVSTLADFSESSWDRFSQIVKKPLIFLGLSVRPEEAKKFIDADFRPPIRRGDLLDAVKEGYRVIGIADGVFHHDFSVSLQEIREAIELGVSLVGASSMGALRAADASSLGMKGVGWIYEAYQSETIDSDDEVAVSFDEHSQGTTVPLVNVRVTLIKAVNQGHISSEISENALMLAKKIPYWDRTYPFLISVWKKELPRVMNPEFESWFQKNYIDIKREDTFRLLEYINTEHAYSQNT